MNNIHNTDRLVNDPYYEACHNGFRMLWAEGGSHELIKTHNMPTETLFNQVLKPRLNALGIRCPEPRIYENEVSYE